MINRLGIASVLVLLLGGCNQQLRATDAEYCQGLGHAPGSAAHEQCMQEEKMQRFLKEQQEQNQRQDIRQRQEQTLPNL